MTHVQHIVRAFNAASADDLATGLGWYQRAHNLAVTLAAGTPFTVEQTAGVIAALSPRTGWAQNVTAASELVNAAAWHRDMPIVAGLLSNRRKAWAILHTTADPLTILRGPKVTAFYRAIMGDSDAVTVDMWAARAAGFDGDITPKRSAELQDAYREAASIIGHPAREVQAAVWVFYRRVCSTIHSQWLLQEDFQ